MALTIFQSGDQSLQLLQTSWALQLNPVLKNALVNGQLLTEIALVSGSNTINHKLGRALKGWIVVRQRASASFYDTQDSNSTPSITLQLVASAKVTVDLYVF